MLAAFWRVFAVVLISLLGIKVYTALTLDLYAIASLVALFVFFYVLFLLEGLQIAGLQLKEHCEEAIVRFLTINRLSNNERTLRIAELYKYGFHSFLSGRQILVIMSVVSMAAIINSITVQSEVLGVAESSFILALINSPIANFLLSTLLPAWVSQLLPQFIADNRSIGFVSLPGAEFITRLAIRLDKIHASRPAFDLLEWTRKSSTFSKKDKIHVGRKQFFESLASYIGISREKVLLVVCGDKVTERSTYHIRKEKLVTLRHKIRPQTEIDKLELSLMSKETVITGQPSISKGHDRGGLYYMLEISLSFAQDSRDEYSDITIINEYRGTNLSTSGNDSMMFETDIPTRQVSIILMPDSRQLINNVNVDAYHYTQRRFYDDESFAYGIVEVSSDDSNNHRIDIDYPLYGIEYRVAYQREIDSSVTASEREEGLCDVRVMGQSSRDRDEYNVMQYTLSTKGLDDYVHLLGPEGGNQH